MNFNQFKKMYPVVLLDIIHKYTNPISCEICNNKFTIENKKYFENFRSKKHPIRLILCKKCIESECMYTQTFIPKDFVNLKSIFYNLK